jgi:outer membrane protein OmpA-like peptidoglycan-associated protein
LKKIYRGTREIRLFKEDGYYKYYIEETPSYPDARRVLKESGVENAFIAAYKGDTKWKLNEAIALQKKERIQLAQAGSENKTIELKPVGRNAVEHIQDEQKTTAPALGIIKTNKEVQDEADAENSVVSSQAIAVEENSPDNNHEKGQVRTMRQVDNSMSILPQSSDSLETDRVAGERNLTQSSSPDGLIAKNKARTEQNQPENKNRNSDPTNVAENAAQTTQQNKLNDVAPTRDNYQPPGLPDRNNVSAKSVHPIDSSQYQSPAILEYRAHDTGKNNDFQYRVQIAASRSELRSAQLKKIYSGGREILSFKEDGYYKYYIGEASRYYVASQILKESPVENAFISVYKGTTKWQLQDAIALQNKVPLIRSELAKTDSLIKIVTVNFELDEFILPPNERLHLQEHVIGQLKANEGYHAIVNGYADIRGSEEYNFGLSQERAFFVEQLIVDGGIPSGKVTTQYFGESQVIKYCPENERCDESIHQANRRVEILLLMNRRQH